LEDIQIYFERPEEAHNMTKGTTNISESMRELNNMVPKYED